MSFEDQKRLVRELDKIWNGDGAAKQASLCDLVCQLAIEVPKLRTELEAARADAKEAWEKLGEQCIAHTATIQKLAAEQAKSMQLREALESCGYADDRTDPEMCGPYYDAELVQQALAIQPDDAALKAWLGEPVAEVDDSGVVIVCRYDYKPKDKFYSPKGLK